MEGGDLIERGGGGSLLTFLRWKKGGLSRGFTVLKYWSCLKEVSAQIFQLVKNSSDVVWT